MVYSSFLKQFSRPCSLSFLIFMLIFMPSYPTLPGLPPGANELFQEASFPEEAVHIEGEALARQIDQVLQYFQEYGTKDPQGVSPGMFSGLGITLADVSATLCFMRDILKEDLRRGEELRLKDGRFLIRHFRCFRWHPRPGNPEQPGRIRITRYAVFTVPGRGKREGAYRYALYQLPDDEQGMTLEEAEKHRHRLSRFRYSKQQVMAGAYDKGGAKSLVWLTRGGLEKALMQGTICVRFKHGRLKYFNVNRHNGIPFDPNIENPRDQQRYWYFAEINAPRGYGLDIESMITIYPHAAFAGDVFNLGLGKLIGIRYPKPNSHGHEIRLGILADTGGIFSPNLNQLDYFTGVIDSQEKFKNAVKAIPEYVEAFILIKKKTGRGEAPGFN